MHTPLIILGLSPGTRCTGFAVLQGGELRDWGVKGFRGAWSRAKLRKATRTIGQLQLRHGVDIVAMKCPQPSRTSPALTHLVEEIAALSARRGLMLFEYSIEDILAHFAPGERINKARLAELVASQHPILYPTFEVEKQRKNPYHMRMFEAVAAASVCLHHQDTQ